MDMQDNGESERDDREHHAAMELAGLYEQVQKQVSPHVLAGFGVEDGCAKVRLCIEASMIFLARNIASGVKEGREQAVLENQFNAIRALVPAMKTAMLAQRAEAGFAHAATNDRTLN